MGRLPKIAEQPKINGQYSKKCEKQFENGGTEGKLSNSTIFGHKTDYNGLFNSWVDILFLEEG